MRWREQLYSETCTLKKVAVSDFEEWFQQKRLNCITRRRQLRASETEEGREEKLKKMWDEDREVQDLAVLK